MNVGSMREEGLETVGLQPSLSSHAPVDAGDTLASKTSIASTVVLGINRFMGLRASSKPENPNGLAVLPAEQSAMHGALYTQGAKTNSWYLRYFVLQVSPAY